ncbi:hypothetical protein VTN02DRAFT_3045 [Thermoascus thermophilus]
MPSPAAYEDSPFQHSPESPFTPPVQDEYRVPHTPGPFLYPSDHTLGLSPDVTVLQAQSNQRSLFQSSSELPRFFVPYRWWEDEATTVLWTFDIQEIRRVVRFGLFPDENLPRTVLQSRNASTVDDFLIALIEPQEIPFISNLSHVQKVEEILRRFKTSRFPTIPWSWFPSQGVPHADPREIASKIDAESHIQFKGISFEEWVRYSLGYPAPSVDWFLLQHSAFYIHLSNYLSAYPDEVGKYSEVEKHLRNRSPFAHRVLVQCLLSYRTDDDHDMPLTFGPGFEFIAGPIQTIFQDHPPSLTSILKMLSVLAIRFRKTYVHTSEMDWNRKFETSVPFIDDLFASISAGDLARTLTSSDEEDFSRLSRQNIINEDALVKDLITRWNALSTAVWECCTALPELTGYIQECVQALHEMRNYNSATAILNGLQNHKIASLRGASINNAVGAIVLDPALPSEVLYLLNASENYAAYRQRMQEAPGIPFLLPHVREYRRRGAPALTELFQVKEEVIG